MTPLCSGGDRIAFFASAKTNQGSHFVDWTRFALLLFDAATGEYEISRLGGLNFEGELRPETGTVVPGAKVGFAQKLHDWRTEDCLWPGSTAQMDPTEVHFEYSLGDSSLTIRLAGRNRVLQDGLTFNPAAEIAEMSFEGFDRPSPLRAEPETSIFTIDPPPVVVAEVELASRTLFIFRLPSDGSRGGDVLVATVSAKLKRAKSWLVNAHALEDLHQKGQWAAAAKLFEIAAELDPDNPTPLYNWACAEARQGKIEISLRLLSRLPQTSALRAKLARDPDFDGIRKDPGFAGYLAALPTSD